MEPLETEQLEATGAEYSAPGQLPFGFAKQYGVLLDRDADTPRVLHQGQLLRRIRDFFSL